VTDKSKNPWRKCVKGFYDAILFYEPSSGSVGFKAVEVPASSSGSEIDILSIDLPPLQTGFLRPPFGRLQLGFVIISFKN